MASDRILENETEKYHACTRKSKSLFEQAKKSITLHCGATSTKQAITQRQSVGPRKDC